MPVTHIEKIVILINKENFVDAEKQLKQLIYANPKNYIYLNLLSIAYAKQNKIDLQKLPLKILRIQDA